MKNMENITKPYRKLVNPLIDHGYMVYLWNTLPKTMHWEYFFNSTPLLLKLKYAEMSYFLKNTHSNLETGEILNEKHGKYSQNYKISWIPCKQLSENPSFFPLLLPPFSSPFSPLMEKIAPQLLRRELADPRWRTYLQLIPEYRYKLNGFYCDESVMGKHCE